MGSVEQSSAPASLRRSYLISRPYSIPYGSLCCLCGLLCGIAAPSNVDYVLALSMPSLLAMAGGALNDFAHWEADQRASRQRNYGRVQLLTIGIFFCGLALLTAGLAGGRALLYMVLTLAAITAYGVLKRFPAAGIILRAATTSLLVLTVGELTGHTERTWWLALGAGLMDAAGNLWGDIRDIEPDAKTGTDTIAVRSLRAAILLSLALYVLAAFTLSFFTYAVLPCALLITGVILIPGRREGHLWFLITKYVTIGIVALALKPTDVQLAMIAVLLLLAVPSIRLYQQLHNLPVHR